MYNKKLETFIQVADFGSISKAAVNMFISPTAVMQQINQLEKQFNLKLFTRSNQGLQLSEAGKSIYADVKYIMQYSNESLLRARRVADESEYLIRIGTSLMNNSQNISNLFNQISNIDSRFQFHVVPFDDYRDSYQQTVATLGKMIDIIVGVYGFSTWMNGVCSTLELDLTPIYCAISSKHRLATKQILEIEDLYGETIFVPKEGDSCYLDTIRKDFILNHPKIKLVTVNHYDLTIYNQCETTNNIALTTKYWETVHPMLMTVPVNWNYSVPFGLLYSQRPSKGVGNLINMVKKIRE